MKNAYSSLLLVGLLACSQSGAEKPAETAAPASASATPVTATADAPAAVASNAAAITHGNGIIVSGGKFKERTVISQPNRMGSTQIMKLSNDAPATSMISLNASNEDYTRTYGITVYLPANKPGTYELGPNQQARVTVSFNDLNTSYDSFFAGAAGTLTVTKFDEDGKVIDGTYSGTFVDQDGNKITVHEGRFANDQSIVVGK